MKNLFITHLYRQGNGDIIQLLSNIHNAVSNNAYILFDNSFTRDGIKRPFSYEEQFAVLENQIKKIIFWNEVFLDNAPAVNIIYKGRIINSKKHFEFLTDNNKLFDVATLTKIDLNTEQCKVTYQEDWINFVKKHNMVFFPSTFKHQPKDHIGLSLRTDYSAYGFDTLDWLECEYIEQMFQDQKIKYIDYFIDQSLLQFPSHKKRFSSWKGQGIAFHVNDTITNQDIQNFKNFCEDLKTCKFLVCTEGGMSHMAACMRIPFYIFGNFNRDNEEAFLELWQNYYAPHGIVTEDLITLKERVYET